MKNFKKKICFVTSTRADFGILSDLIKEVNKNNIFKVNLIATGSHLEKKYGNTIQEIENEGIEIHKKIKILSKLNNKTCLLKNSTKIIEKFSIEFKKNTPELLLLLGDRYEIFCIAYTAFILGIPIAHFYGGEVTQNSLDDTFRHAITKLSNFHLVSNKKYLKRVLQLGESKKNVFNIGSLSLDKIKEYKYLSKKEIESKLRFKFKEKLIICTLHPETNNLSRIKNQTLNTLDALNKLKNVTIIFTLPNDDLGSDFIAKLIKNFCKKNKNSYYFKSLGKLLYFSFVKIANLVIGNSSSGIIEVPSLGTYSLNIGNRQLGRIKAKSVYSVDFDKIKIFNSITKLLNKKKKSFKNPYYKINSVKKTILVLKKINFKKKIQKKFIDIKK